MREADALYNTSRDRMAAQPAVAPDGSRELRSRVAAGERLGRWADRVALDFAVTFEDVVRIAEAAADPRAGWSALVRYLEGLGETKLSSLANVTIDSDVDGVRRQLEALLKTEPPPADVDAIYFGLFDALDEVDQETLGFYVAGVVGFDPDDGDSLCNPAWWPEARYLESSALDAIKHAEVLAGTDGQPELRTLLGYAGQLGAALLVSRFASEGLLAERRRVVGFDSGDFAILN